MEDRYWRDSNQRYKLVELRPGEIHVTSEPTFITTLLGSCVSVCLYSIEDGAGAMSHSVLPGSLCRGRAFEDVRYVENAIDRMLDQLSGLGVSSSYIRAKIFGGAEMFRLSDSGIRLARMVGDGNTTAARNFLKSRGITVVSECVGGNTGRKLVFNTETGVVFVRRLSGKNPATISSPFGERVA